MIYYNIALLLQQNGFGTIGQTIYINDMPPNPANTLMVMDIVSPPPDSSLATTTANFEIWCRNDSQKTANDILENINKLLHRNHHITLGDYYVYIILATGNIETMGKDTERRNLLKLPFTSIYIDQRTVS